MVRKEERKHNYQQATGHWNILPLTGIVCPVSINSFTIRLEDNDKRQRPESVHT